MKLDAFLATIIIVSFLITIVMAVASYGAYKLRERRRPIVKEAVPGPDGESAFFARVSAADFDDPGQPSPPRG
jgi:hypothetical protein